MPKQNWMLITIAAAVLAVAPTRAHALSGCANNLLAGSYAMQFSGSAQAARLSGLARLTFDADGNVQGYSTVNSNGSSQKRDLSGTYTVNDDCTATLTVADSNGVTQNYSGVIANQGESFLVLQTDAGFEVSASLKRVRNFCQTSDLSGSFGLQYQGVLLDKVQSPLSSVGLVNIDADGNVTAQEFRSISGTSSQVASAGNIVVNSDCSATLTLTPLAATATPVTFQGILGGDGRSIMLVGSDAGSSLTGNITAQ